MSKPTLCDILVSRVIIHKFLPQNETKIWNNFCTSAGNIKEPEYIFQNLWFGERNKKVVKQIYEFYLCLRNGNFMFVWEFVGLNYAEINVSNTTSQRVSN